MFRMGICVGILIMCLVPTSIHNSIRSKSIACAIMIFQKLEKLASEEQKYDICKVPVKED